MYRTTASLSLIRPEREHIGMQRERKEEKKQRECQPSFVLYRRVKCEYGRNWTDATTAVETHDHYHYSNYYYVYACQKLINESKEFVWKVPLCLAFLSEKNVFFSLDINRVKERKRKLLTVLVMNNLSFVLLRVCIRFTTIQGHFDSIELF